MANIKLRVLSAVILASIIVPILAESYEDVFAKLESQNLTVEEIRDEILSIEEAYFDNAGFNITPIEVMKWYSEAPFLGDCQFREFQRREFYNVLDYNETFKQNLRRFLEPSYIRLILYCAENINRVVEASISFNDRGGNFRYRLGLIEKIQNRRVHFTSEDYLEFIKSKLRDLCKDIREDQMKFIFYVEGLEDESRLELSKDIQARLDAAKFVLNGNCIKNQWPLSFSVNFLQIFSEYLNPLILKD